MLSAEQLRKSIEEGIPGARAEVEDTTGTGDHFEAVVVSDEFEGLSLVEQHRLVHRALKPILDSDELHAFYLTTRTPAQVGDEPAGRVEDNETALTQRAAGGSVGSRALKHATRGK